LPIGTIRAASATAIRRPRRFCSTDERPLSALAELTGILGGAILCGMTELAPELARLSPRERLDLIESLWESLDEKDVPLTDAQRAELDRRIVGFDQDGAESIPWDQLRDELRQRR
jgi:putative addiction module component (TIGR02574 family)